MSSPTKITAILIARPGKTEELEALLSGMAPHCRAEPGNLRWDIWQDPSQPECYILDELYVDDAAVTAHRQTPHFQDYLTRVAEIADRTARALKPILLK